MDFSKFLDDDFNVNTWVNDAFKAQQEEEGTIAQNKKDIYAATLVTKLQVFIQEVNKSLEEMSTQVVNSMPRVLRDIEALNQEASYLKQQMQQVKDDIHDVEQKTSHTMKVLVLTDQVRNRVEKSCAALREADNWSSLAAAIEDVFRSGDSHTIAVRLKSMQNSLEILKHSPDYDDKVMHLEALKNRLESHVSPQAVAAFMQHNTEEAKKLQIVFSTINRETELHKYYVKTYSSNLTIHWQEIVANEDDKSLTTVMNELFDLLITTWHSQLPWCRSVFGLANATSILVQLLIQVMMTSKPGFSDVITSALESSDDPKLVILLELHAIATKFSRNLEEAITAACGASSNSKIDAKLSESLGNVLWMPYAPFQMDFKDLETEMLLTKLSEVVMDAGDLMDLTRVLATSADKVFAIASEAAGHCDKLTNFLGAHVLISPLNSFFHNYTDKFSRALRTVNVKYGLNQKDSGNLDISEEHYYSLFQHSLRIIITCGKLLQAFSDFEENLISRILGSQSAGAALVGLLEFESDNLARSNTESTLLHFNYLKKMDVKEYRKLQDMLVSLKQTALSQRALLPTVKQSLTSLNQQAHQLAFDIAFAQIKKQLALIPQHEIWSHANTAGTELVDDADLPSFSLPPTEYATTVGQHLMTLPQHLEPLAAGLSEGSGDLSAMETALHTAKLPFSLEDGGDKTEMDNMADRWLSSIVKASEHTYVEACLQIPSLTTHTAKQLAADLDYMGNVVDSLGLPILKDITLLIRLLRVTEENYSNVAMDAPKRLASSVARIRGIKDM